ncbi:retinol dehydrogenase 7-like isoform X2 [Caloenas nicobarica]|uniref:retinol dehydrogenase 7-like isoform X2 n=1 Tax=Caloenas nicobarica TaxID=187106 RepID=UPI0032B79FD4
MWLYVAAALAGLFLLRRWHRERQTVPGLSEKFVLITGCDSGFGNVLARALDARGLRVLAACLGERGAAELRAAASPRLQTVLLDVTSSQSVAAAAAWVRERVGERGLWGLVNNAGTAVPTAPNEWLSKADFAKVLDVNLLGLIEVTLSLLPLVRRARGRVVNVASVMGRVSFTGGGYCVSKFGVEAFSDSLRTQVINTQILENSLFSAWEGLPEEIKASYGEKYLKEFVAQVRKAQKSCSPDLRPVINCMEHALTSRCPRSRYSAGWDAKLFFIPLSYLPSALADAVLNWPRPKPASMAA